MLDLLAPTTSAPVLKGDREGVQFEQREPFARLTTRISEVTTLEADMLSEVVRQRYSAIVAMLDTLRKRPIRIWNYVPGIVEPVAPGLDRYMAFNRGRHAACSAAWGADAGFSRWLPSASAVGITGPDLVIDCLASDGGGVPVENPRQTASWRYSRRYGPRPPCFSRGTATELDGRRVLLLAGTASIVGEESRHAGDVRAQTRELLGNIEAVIVRAGGSRRHALQQLTELRVYVVHAEDYGIVNAEIRAACGENVRMESALARVCRPELLVEVEGVADL